MEIGEHCFYKTCKRLDFLPFTCQRCLKIFCKEHSSPDQHDCVSLDSSSSEQDKSESSKEQVSFCCLVEDCKRRDLMEMRCPHCEGHFCLQHRHQVQHNCQALPGSRGRGKEGVARVKVQHNSSSGEAGKEQHGGGVAGVKGHASDPKSWSAAKAAKLESTRLKVLLMKLKMKAEGSEAIPMAERVYFQVQLPTTTTTTATQLPGKSKFSPEEGVPMFFSREWSVGKVVDYIAQRHKLKNENNNPLAKQRLVLCDVNRETVEMSKSLKSLLDTGLPNAGTISLRYET